MEGDWTCHRGSRMTELEVQVPFAGDVVRGGAWAFNLCVYGEGAGVGLESAVAGCRGTGQAYGMALGCGTICACSS